ncbi:TPA: hypothetical protein SCW97_001717 [Campylobacter jejuni]|uniref:hypothetical protein n=1 Tax=Campylobacter jejuni TaxID=197 RepID=UPI0008746692|nr:hypothetical protein [Campylobacter jejuni]OEV61796.1 hypothetical protein AJY73_10625 [Campylobacter jejuni]HEG2911586.1 hypothetical protein [Campylobacter jejuni]HEG2942025.1 hypothetical protein [Campylobacter jejuni]
MAKYKWNEMDDSRIKALLKPAFSGGERFSHREHFKIVLTPELEDFFDFWKIKSSKDYEDRLFNEWWFNKARKWGLPSLLHSSQKKNNTIFKYQDFDIVNPIYDDDDYTPSSYLDVNWHVKIFFESEIKFLNAKVTFDNLTDYCDLNNILLFKVPSEVYKTIDEQLSTIPMTFGMNGGEDIIENLFAQKEKNKTNYRKLNPYINITNITRHTEEAVKEHLYRMAEEYIKKQFEECLMCNVDSYRENLKNTSKEKEIFNELANIIDFHMQNNKNRNLSFVDMVGEENYDKLNSSDQKALREYFASSVLKKAGIEFASWKNINNLGKWNKIYNNVENEEKDIFKMFLQNFEDEKRMETAQKVKDFKIDCEKKKLMGVAIKQEMMKAKANNKYISLKEVFHNCAVQLAIAENDMSLYSQNYVKWLKVVENDKEALDFAVVNYMIDGLDDDSLITRQDKSEILALIHRNTNNDNLIREVEDYKQHIFMPRRYRDERGITYNPNVYEIEEEQNLNKKHKL